MRLAILSALADPFGQADPSVEERPAFRRFAGKSVLSHQIDCAAHLGCERILCLSGPSGPDIASARAYAEVAGMRFENIESLARLSVQITADDIVLLLADGVLADCASVVGKLADRAGVLAFPAEAALPLGFERLDAERAWSGVLRMRGAGVAKLADMPLDCDMASSLLRIALQAGVPIVELPDNALVDAIWQRRVDRQASSEADRRWMRLRLRPASFDAPGRALADRVALRLTHDGGGGRWPRAPHLTALTAAALALALGLAGKPVIGLAMVLIATLALAVAEMFDRVATLGAPPRKAGAAAPAARLLADVLFIALLALTIVAEPSWLRIALPMGLVLALRLGAQTAPAPLHDLFADRSSVIAVLLAAAALGWTAPAVAGLMFLGLIAMLLAARAPRFQITAD